MYREVNQEGCPTDADVAIPNLTELTDAPARVNPDNRIEPKMVNEYLQWFAYLQFVVCPYLSDAGNLVSLRKAMEGSIQCRAPRSPPRPRPPAASRPAARSSGPVLRSNDLLALIGRSRCLSCRGDADTCCGRPGLDVGIEGDFRNPRPGA